MDHQTFTTFIKTAPIDPSHFNSAVSIIKGAIQPWYQSLRKYSNYLIISLGTIQIAWTFGFYTLKKNCLSGAYAIVARRILIIGFCLAVITYGEVWIPDIIRSFEILGSGAGSHFKTLNPGSVMYQGVAIAGELFKISQSYGFLTGIFGTLISLFTGLVIAFAYLLIAIDLAITMIEGYILAAVVPIFFSFGVNDFTSPMMKKLINEILGVGIKLMGLYTIISIGISLSGEWDLLIKKSTVTHQYVVYVYVMGGAVLFYMISKNIPARLASLAGCGTMYNHGETTMAAGAAAAAVMTKTLASFKEGEMGSTGAKTAGAVLRGGLNMGAAAVTGGGSAAIKGVKMASKAVGGAARSIGRGINKL